MKTITLSLIIIIAAGLTSIRAQNTWIQKADFGGTAREGAVGFSIGNYGYIGTGLVNGASTKDFWQYDPATDAWTQKADFGGAARNYAAGFCIDRKGYLGTGTSNGVHFKDFWEYDSDNNTWTQKSDFGGAARSSAACFSIVTNGYLGTGFAGSPEYTPKKDFWEYNPDADTWTQKTDFGGIARFGARGFSIGNVGYIGPGGSEVDFWRDDPEAGTWTRKADFGGGVRSLSVAFSINGKGYMGAGWDDLYNFKADFWEYNPDADTWTKKTDFGGNTRKGAAGFSIGSKGYMGTGQSGTDYAQTKDFWEYAPGSEILCSAPTGETTLKITGTSAKLTWDAVPGAVGYVVRYKASNASEWKNESTNNNSKKISGLLPNTPYAWHVRTVCQKSPKIMSDWSSKQEFTTGSLRMEDELEVSIELYPNPVSENFTLDLQLNSATDQSADIFLLNSLGQIIYSERVVAGNGELKTEITMPSTASLGWYTLRVVLSDQVIEKKLLYQK